MNEQKRAEHQQAHRAAVEGGMLPSYGDPRTERAELRKRAERFKEVWGADGQWIQPEDVERLLDAWDSAQSEVAQLRAELEQERAETWKGTDVEWWTDLERRWFGGQTQTDEQREALVKEMILQGKTDAERAEAAEEKYEALTNDMGIRWRAVRAKGKEQSYVSGSWMIESANSALAALSEAPVTEGHDYSMPHYVGPEPQWMGPERRCPPNCPAAIAPPSPYGPGAPR